MRIFFSLTTTNEVDRIKLAHLKNWRTTLKIDACYQFDCGGCAFACT